MIPRAVLVAVVILLLLVSSVCVWAQESHPFLDLLARAQASSQAQNWTDAASQWERVVQSNPTVAQFWYELGMARFNAGQHREAIPALEKARELGYGGISIKVAYDIARAFAALKEKENTLLWLERSLEDGFRSRERMRTEEAFKFLQEEPRFKELTDSVDTSRMSRDEGWQHDLAFLEKEVKRMHWAPFRKISQADFEREGQELRKEVPRLTDNQVIVRVMRWMSRIGDGHTGTILEAVPTWTSSIPLQFEWFEEGFYVIAADSLHGDLVGARVLEVGEHQVERVIQEIDAILHQDNPQGLKRGCGRYLRYPQLLNGLGLLPDSDRIPLTIVDTGGKQRTVTVTAVPNDPEFNRITSHPKWRTAYENAPGPVPLYLKDRRAMYWFEQIPGSSTVYFQFNSVSDGSTESLQEFLERLFAFLDERKIEKLIIDLRWNNGGNTKLLPPLIQGLIRNERINQPGHLYVVAGRYTYSAAMNAATMLERHTEALFVGEPTPSSPNFVGESNVVALPYSRVAVSISDLYWQSSWPTDRRTWIAPALYAPPSFEAYRSKRDPALEAILGKDWNREPRLEQAANPERSSGRE